MPNSDYTLPSSDWVPSRFEFEQQRQRAWRELRTGGAQRCASGRVLPWPIRNGQRQRPVASDDVRQRPRRAASLVQVLRQRVNWDGLAVTAIVLSAIIWLWVVGSLLYRFASL